MSSASQEIFPPFVEPEASLPCSQDPATDPYPEPDEPSPHLQPCFPKVHFNISLSSMRRSCESPFPTKI
jgi:hypothetical protein